jgi:hypothetical protein
MTYLQYLRKRVRYWLEKATDPYWQWGHPDEWSEAEWFYYMLDKSRGR